MEKVISWLFAHVKDFWFPKYESLEGTSEMTDVYLSDWKFFFFLQEQIIPKDLQQRKTF